VSRAAAELDEQLGAWRNRPIGEITYLILDARYEKVRHDGAIVPCALLTAIGVGPDGKRSILGCSVQLSEAETHCTSENRHLQKRCCFIQRARSAQPPHTLHQTKTHGGLQRLGRSQPHQSHRNCGTQIRFPSRRHR
jgi:hypothetical protein